MGSQRLPLQILLFRAESGNLFFQILARRSSLVANCLQVKNRSGYAERGGPKKIWLRSKLPKIRAQESGNAHNQIANQIIRADHLPAPLRFAVANDQRLA